MYWILNGNWTPKWRAYRSDLRETLRIHRYIQSWHMSLEITFQTYFKMENQTRSLIGNTMYCTIKRKFAMVVTRAFDCAASKKLFHETRAYNKAFYYKNHQSIILTNCGSADSRSLREFRLRWGWLKFLFHIYSNNDSLDHVYSRHCSLFTHFADTVSFA